INQENDRNLGTFLRILQSEDLLKRNILIVSSTFFHPLEKKQLEEETDVSIHFKNIITPLFIHFPWSIKQPLMVPQIVSGCDITPTLLHYLNITSGQRLDGISYIPLLNYQHHPGRSKPIFMDGQNKGCMMTEGIKVDFQQKKQAIWFNYFDLDQDPLEKKPLNDEDNFYLLSLRQKLLCSPLFQKTTKL
ncbi:sulfatase/phosphatase domain-containing protein, partial [candidate division CSSED10-310 bacterium]